MPLDSNILLQSKPVNLPDPLSLAGNALAIQGAQQSLQRNALAYDQAEQAATETNALRARVAQPDFSSLDPTQQIAEIQRVAPIAGQPIVDKMITNRKTMVETGNAQQTGDASRQAALAKVIAVADTPAELIQNGELLVKQGVVDPKQIAPVEQLLRSGQFDNNPAAWKQFKQHMLDGIMNPEALNTALQPKPTAVQTNGGTAFVNTNPQAGPVAPMSGVIPGDPKIVTGAQGEQMRVAPDGSSYGLIPTAAADAAAVPVGWTGAPPAGRFKGDPNAIQTQINAMPAGPDKDGAQQAFNAWKGAGAPQGGTVNSASAGTFPTTVPADLIASNGRRPGEKDPNVGEDAKNAGKYEADLNDSVTSGRNLMQLNGTFQTALQNYKTGPGANTRLAIAKALSAFGVSDSVVEAVNRGSISDAQEIQKLAAQGAMQALKTSMDGQGRISQAEFKIFKDNNPNIELDPNAIQKIQQFQAQQYQRAFAEQQALADYRSKGGDPARWPAVWSKMLDANGLSQPAVANDAKGTPGAALNPPTAKRVVQSRVVGGRTAVLYSDGTTGWQTP